MTPNAINSVLYNVDQTADTTSTEKAQARTNIGAQGALTAGANISISNDTISAVDTTYSAGTGLNLNGTTFSVDTDVIQGKLTPGANIQISNTNEISATDTTYSAGTGLNLNGTTFSVDTTAIQEKLTAGSNINISGNTISATDTTYSAGSGLNLNGTTFSVDTTTIQGKLTAGPNITINGNTISATDTKYSAGSGLSLNGTTFSVDTSTIQQKLTAGDNITINGSTISATDTNTHRPINVNGSQLLGDNTTPLNLKPGSNVTITPGSNGDVTIAASSTSYTAGTGLTLSGNEFSVTNPFNPNGDYSGDTLKANSASAADYALTAADYTSDGGISSQFASFASWIGGKQDMLPTTGTPSSTYAINISGHADSADAATWASSASAAASGSTLETQVNNGLYAYKETYTNVTLIQGDIHTSSLALEIGQEGSPGNGIRLFFNNNNSTGHFDVSMRSNTWNNWMAGGQIIWMLACSYGNGVSATVTNINNDTLTLVSSLTTQSIGTIDMGGAPGQIPVKGTINGRFYFISPQLVRGLLVFEMSFDTSKSTAYGGSNTTLVVGKAEWFSYADHKVTSQVI